MICYDVKGQQSVKEMLIIFITFHRTLAVIQHLLNIQFLSYPVTSLLYTEIIVESKLKFSATGSKIYAQYMRFSFRLIKLSTYQLSLYFSLGMEYERYKIIVQVVIGEQRGEGVKYVDFIANCL